MIAFLDTEQYTHAAKDAWMELVSWYQPVLINSVGGREQSGYPASESILLWSNVSQDA